MDRQGVVKRMGIGIVLCALLVSYGTTSFAITPATTNQSALIAEAAKAESSFEGLAGKSELAVVAVVGDSTAGGTSQMPATNYDLKVKEVLRNTQEYDTEIVTLEVSGAPKLEKGKAYLLLLKKSQPEKTLSSIYRLAGSNFEGAFLLSRPKELQGKVLSKEIRKEVDYFDYQITSWRNTPVEQEVNKRTVKTLSPTLLNAKPPRETVAEVVYPTGDKFTTFEENKTGEEFNQLFQKFGAKTSSLLLTDKLNQQAKEKSDQNIVYSPASLAYALGALGQGTAGETRKKVSEAMGVADIGAQAENYGKLYRRLYSAEEGQKLTIANSIWVKSGGSLEAPFLNSSVKNFYASVHETDFSAQAVKEISKWISDNTGGKLAPEIEPNPNMYLMLINTVYFNASWQKGFEKADIIEQPFHLADGSAVPVQFLSRMEKGHAYFETDSYLQSDMFFQGGYKISFVLPKNNVTPLQIVSSQDMMGKIINPGEVKTSGNVDFLIPKFKFHNEHELKGLFNQMGLGGLLSAGADLSNMTKADIYLGSVEQGTYIDLNENGCEAAAYTSMADEGAIDGPEPELPKIDMKLDKPFLFVIQSHENMPLFVGVVNNPMKD